ncbi:MAG: hypothetical protein PHE32_02295 [Candidatus Shapirobacteria bacterium]|nr:hypothetical protein [Candidatus Shapirobacteria bacterium]MDD4410501.1 hypothetical protein [Candidatus Shapirobacteria bacterium]
MATEFELPKNALLIGSLSHLIEASAADLKDFLDLVNHFYRSHGDNDLIITSKIPSLSTANSYNTSYFNFNKSNQKFYLISRAKGYDFILETLSKISDYHVREAYYSAMINFRLKNKVANK